MGELERVTGPGRKPPSVPIWVIVGPLAVTSGTPPARPSRVSGEYPAVPAAPVTAGTIGTSPAPGLTSLPVESHICPLDAAQYSWRLRVRSSLALRIRSR